MQKEMFIVGYYFNPRSGYVFNVFQKAVLKLARKLWTAEHITKGLDYLGPVKFGPVGEVAGTVSIYIVASTRAFMSVGPAFRRPPSGSSPSRISARPSASSMTWAMAASI